MITAGMIIGERYEILEKVGSGGMADVYKAKCHRLNRIVAMKILKPEFSADQNFVAKFRAEAQSVAGLSHPNIVSVYDVGEDNGLYYIVMELVRGVTLKRYIEKKGCLDVKEAVGIAIQIAQGLEAAHEHHIVHRDIKPQNIMISVQGEVKVADFGIAKATSSNTITQNAVGSVYYISPEQARGGYSDERGDIYSLGISMYEMLCGHVPYTGENPVAVALLHIQATAVPIREANRQVSFALDHIIQKCMQKRPENRYQSATELIADLKRSMVEPNGDFVKIPNSIVPNTRTMEFTETEVNAIKTGTQRLPQISPDEYKKTKAGARILKEETEEMEVIDSGKEKVLVVCSIFITLLLATAIIAFVLKYTGIFESFFGGYDIVNTPSPSPTMAVSETVTPVPTPTPGMVMHDMPGLVGYTFAQAQELLSISGNYVVKSEEAYSVDYAPGKIMAQYPEKGSSVYDGMTVILTISAGAEPVIIPNVYMLSHENAAAVLGTYDLKVSYKYEATNVISDGLVIRTEPERYSSLRRGDTVVLVVSEAVKQTRIVVPWVVGQKYEDGLSLLVLAGLQLGNVTYEPSVKYAEGYIINQSLIDYTTPEEGIVVDIVKSKGLVTQEQYAAYKNGEDVVITLTPTPTATPTPTPTPTYFLVKVTATPTPTPTTAVTPSLAPVVEITPTPVPMSMRSDDDNYYITIPVSENPFTKNEAGYVFAKISYESEMGDSRSGDIFIYDNVKEIVNEETRVRMNYDQFAKPGFYLVFVVPKNEYGDLSPGDDVYIYMYINVANKPRFEWKYTLEE